MTKKVMVFALFWLLLLPKGAHSQINRYVVHFTDKKGTPFYIAQPQEFLSERAIERKLRHNIQITESDLPVTPAYLQQLTTLGAEVYFSSRWMNLALIQTEQKLLADIASLPFVAKIEYVAPGKKLITTLARNEKYYIEQPHNDRILASTALQNNMLSLQHMHKESLEGQGVLIAVLDAGFAGVDTAPFFGHLRQGSTIRDTFNFVSNLNDVYGYDDHGTNVLSVLAARMLLVNNGDTTQLTGTAPGAEYALYLTEDVSGEYRIEEYNWLFAAELADSLGVDIIHCSLGYSTFSDPSMNYTVDDMDGQTAVCTRAANLAAEKGIFVVASAGNEGRISWKKVTAPADSPYVLSVGAIDASGTLASFSSHGPSADGRIKPEVVAMGVAVTVGTRYGTVSTSSGTSFSAPIVSGMVAGLMQANPAKSRQEIFSDIIKSGSKYQAPDNMLGYGVPDFIKAIDNRALSVAHKGSESIRVYPNPLTGNRLHIDVSKELKTDELSADIYDINGKLLVRKQYSRPSSETFVFECPDIAPGIYILQISSATAKRQIRLLKN